MLPTKVIKGKERFSTSASMQLIRPFNSALEAFIAISVLGYKLAFSSIANLVF